MDLIAVGLLVFVPFLSLADGSAEIQTRVCGLDRVGYVKSSNGYFVFVKEKKVEDEDLICASLDLYFENGCLFGDEEWGRIRKKYCDGKFSSHTRANYVDLLQRAGRKLLHQASSNVSNPGLLSRNNQQKEKILTPAKMALAIPVFFLLSCALLCPCFHAKKKVPSDQNITSTDIFTDSVSAMDVSSPLRKPPGTPLRVPPSPSRFAMSPQRNRFGSMQLSVNQIIKATQNFSDSLKIGDGGFGFIYKAVLPDGQVVAVKRAKKDHFVHDEFANEVELLTKIDHINLVRLLGYTDKGNERIIITEFVPNGTLREHLDGLRGKILDFNQRLEIAIDVAHALTYLHLYTEKPIIHRDVKSTNIMLTESFRAKVSDFGFARIGPTEAEQTHVLTQVKGTAGYLDPEYLKTYKLTPKSDVFSFGILLLEILSARRPVEQRRSIEERSIEERITIRWAFKNYNEGNVMAILDPMLKEAVDGDIVMKMLGLAFECAAPTRVDRPDMKVVGEQLWEIRKYYGRTRRSS